MPRRRRRRWGRGAPVPEVPRPHPNSLAGRDPALVHRMEDAANPRYVEPPTRERPEDREDDDG